jgi:hypothetical protein
MVQVQADECARDGQRSQSVHSICSKEFTMHEESYIRRHEYTLVS